ncbi:MAG: cysteine--tRNA ligase [Rhizomicrobium sp.]
MTLRLYNTLTRQKEDFSPLDPQNVRLYVCGPTVYDYAHIGNARPVIVFDVLFRLLRHLYGADHVTYVRNITDIDDKINARAAEVAAAKGVSVETARVEITNATAQQYLDDVTALGCLPPTQTPRATEYVRQMIAMIERLVAAGHAYAAEGHVLFDVSSKADYGKLARRSLDEMLAGARVEVAPYKKNPMDFVLWKPSDAQTPGWDSPWGRGRPGWHIECSAMGEALLGETFDIHGGGIDLMFPHHENEIAQSEGAHHDHPLARVWMHNGFLQVEGEKMAKSLGNFITINELLTTNKFGGWAWPGEVLRLNMLRRHYKLPHDWSFIGLEECRKLYLEWLAQIPQQIADAAREEPTGLLGAEIVDALSDDLNTHMALQHVHQLRNDAARSTMTESALRLAVGLDFLGLLPQNIGVTIDELLGKPKVDETEIVSAIAARNAARKAKNFKESDRIRDELLAKGIVLKDGPNGTTWEVKR